MVHPSAPTEPVAPRGRVKVRHPLVARRCHVGAVAHLTPSMVRVTLVGEDLAGFVSDGPTDHLKVFFPDPVSGVLAAPRTGTDGLVPPEGEVVVRDYTPRAFRPVGASGGPELDLDLVLHGDAGPASAWAARASVGDELVVAGPRGSSLLPASATSFLLGADETALPAVARWLTLLAADRPDARVTVLAEVGGVPDHAALEADDGSPLHPTAVITWLHRGTSRAGAGGPLEDALRGLGPLDDGCFVWFGGEAGMLLGVRRYLRHELGMRRDRAEVSGYWRRGTAGLDHHAPIDPTDPD